MVQARTLALLFFAALPAHSQSQPSIVHVWGSPQMGDLLARYESGFRKLHAGVAFENDLRGTLTAVAGVYTGRAEIGLLGREIWPTEVQAFTQAAGHPPNVIEVATGSYDVPKATFALMIVVPKANPIASLTTEQLARIFSSTNAARTWGDLGLAGVWATRPIHPYGFAVDNDKSQIFAHWIFSANDPAPNGADAGELIVQAVAADPAAIGISNVHYASDAVRTVPIAPLGHAPVAPTKANVASRAYPLTRAVYMVLGDAPSATTKEFIRYVLSDAGKQAVIDEGNYLPLTDENAASQLRKLAAR
jgi:phosphate transport system substrate-binding protein